MKKRLFAFFILIALLIMPAVSVLAANDSTSTRIITDAAAPVVRGNRVEDNAGLLSDEQTEALADKLDRISKKHDCDIVIITTKSLGRKMARRFAADFYETCGYSKDGIAMLFCTETRDYVFVAKGKCEAVFTDRVIISHLEKVVVEEHLSHDQYNRAFNAFAESCDSFMSNVEKGKPAYKKKPISTGLAAVGAAIVGLLSGGGVTGSMASKLKSVRYKSNASDYVENGSLCIVDQREMFLYSNVVKTEKPRDNERSSGGGSSGGSFGSFTSSSGASWSGSSGKC